MLFSGKILHFNIVPLHPRKYGDWQKGKPGKNAMVQLEWTCFLHGGVASYGHWDKLPQSPWVPTEMAFTPPPPLFPFPLTFDLWLLKLYNPSLKSNRELYLCHRLILSPAVKIQGTLSKIQEKYLYLKNKVLQRLQVLVKGATLQIYELTTNVEVLAKALTFDRTFPTSLGFFIT